MLGALGAAVEAADDHGRVVLERDRGGEEQLAVLLDGHADRAVEGLAGDGVAAFEGERGVGGHDAALLVDQSAAGVGEVAPDDGGDALEAGRHGAVSGELHEAHVEHLLGGGGGGGGQQERGGEEGGELVHVSSVMTQRMVASVSESVMTSAPLLGSSSPIRN